ncbi:Deoxycytidine kinase 1 [Batrachochytrium dendrobatidis]|nr:Deoxycytidine kinase 1 [Batrachochytrium dendrobatidis]KAK5670807.1 Deoxycytidine kinase 1 [Batrachochytrium dendrobatidis]
MPELFKRLLEQSLLTLQPGTPRAQQPKQSQQEQSQTQQQAWHPLPIQPPTFAVVRSLFIPPPEYLAVPSAQPYLHRLEVGDHIQLLEVNSAWYRGLLYPASKPIVSNSSLGSLSVSTDAEQNNTVQSTTNSSTFVGVRPCIVPIAFVTLVGSNKAASAASLTDLSASIATSTPQSAQTANPSSNHGTENVHTQESNQASDAALGDSNHNASSSSIDIASKAHNDLTIDTAVVLHGHRGVSLPAIPNPAAGTKTVSRHHPPLLIPPHDSIDGLDDPFLDGVASTLREWCIHINGLLMDEKYDMYPIVSSIFRTVAHARQTLRSRTLSVAETISCRRKIIAQINTGNKLLNLDTVLYDATTGQLLSDQCLSVIDLYTCFSNDLLNSKSADGDKQPNGESSTGHDNELTISSSTSLSISAVPDAADNGDSKAVSHWLTKSSNGPQVKDDPYSISRFHMYMEFKSCVASYCQIGEMIELHFFIYDATNRQILSEEYSIRLNSNGQPSEERSSLDFSNSEKLATLFTDVSGKDISHKLMLVCRMVHVRVASISNNQSVFDKAMKSGAAVANTVRGKFSSSAINASFLKGSKDANPLNPENLSGHRYIRRQFGAAAVPISKAFEHLSNDTVHTKECHMKIVIPTYTDSDSVHLDDLLSQPDLLSAPSFAQSITVSIATFSNDSPIYACRSGILTDIVPSCRLGYFGAISWAIPQVSRMDRSFKLLGDRSRALSSDSKNTIPIVAKRNTIFLTLEEGSFPSVRLSSGRGIQVSVRARLANGECVRGAFLAGAGEEAVDYFDSIVFANSITPKWSETIRIDLVPSTFRKAHLFLTFRVCAPSTAEIIGDKFAFAFIPLIKSQYAVITDSVHQLTLYKFDRFTAVPSIYLNFQAGPNLFVPAHMLLSPTKSIAEAADAISKLPTLKDTLTVRTSLFSTVMTQDPALLNLLNWRQHVTVTNGNITPVLAAFAHVDDMEVYKFMPAIFKELMGLWVATMDPKLTYFPSGNASAIQRHVFQKLVFVLTVAADKRFVNNIESFEAFVQSHVEGTPAWVVISEQLEQLLRSGADIQLGKLLRATIKVMHNVTAVIIYAASALVLQESSSMPVTSINPIHINGVPFNRYEPTTCVERVLALHEGIQYLVSLDEPDHALAAQVLALQHFPNFLIMSSRVFDSTQTEKLIVSFLTSINVSKPKLKSGRLVLLRTLMTLPEFSAYLGCLRKITIEILLDSMTLSTTETLHKNLNSSSILSHGSDGRVSSNQSYSTIDMTFNSDVLDSKVVVQITGLLEEILHHIQPRVNMIKTRQNESVDQEDNTEECLGQMVKKDIGKTTWGNIFFAICSLFLALHNQVKKVCNNEDAVGLATSPSKGQGLSANAICQQRKELQDLGAIIVSMMSIFSSSEIQNILKDRTTTLGVVSTAQLLVIMIQAFQVFLQPDVFNTSWLTFHITVVKTTLKFLDIIKSTFIMLHAYHKNSLSFGSGRQPGASEITLTGADQLTDGDGVDFNSTSDHNDTKTFEKSELSESLQQQALHAESFNLTSILELGWGEFFQVLIDLIGVPMLNLAKAGPQRARIVQKLDGDIRRDAAMLLVDSWDSCSKLLCTEQRLQAMPSGFIGSLIELTLHDHSVMRNATVDVLYGILKAEFMAEENFKRIEGDCFDYVHTAIENGDIGDMRATGIVNNISRSNLFSETTTPDEESRKPYSPQQKLPSQQVDLFFITALESRLAHEDHPTFVHLSRTFLRAISKFVKIISVHRQLPLNELDERITSTIRVLRFLKNARRKSLFIKYLHSLFEIHMSEGHWVEAALTLKHHADLLNWFEDVAVEPMPEYGFTSWQTEFERKEQILMQTIKLLEQGQALERAVELCSCLADEYRYRVWDYTHLSSILRFQANMYDKMISEERYYPMYYRVSFYGRGFPRRVSGKQYVYRGEQWEKLSAFCERIQTEYPDSKIISKNGPVDDDIKDSDGRYLQITAVSPVADIREWATASDRSYGGVFSQECSGMFGTIGWDLEARSVASMLAEEKVEYDPTTAGDTAGGLPLWLFEQELFGDDPEAKETLLRQSCIPPQLRSYYEHNEVSIFAFSRPIRRKDGSDPENHPAQEFLELWTEKTILLSEDTFPSMNYRSRVCQVMTFEISPVENAIATVRSKTKQLLGFEKQFRSDSELILSDSARRSTAKAMARVSSNSIVSNLSRGSHTSSLATPWTTTGFNGSVNGAIPEGQISEGGPPASSSANASASSLNNVNPFTMALNGAVDAPVNGGIPMYKAAFLTQPFLGASYNSSKHREILNAAILEHVEVIYRCLAVHDQVVPLQMRPLHDEILKMFNKNYAAEIAELGLSAAPRLSVSTSQYSATQSIRRGRTSTTSPYPAGKLGPILTRNTADRQSMLRNLALGGQLNSAGTAFGDTNDIASPVSSGTTGPPSKLGYRGIKKQSTLQTNLKQSTLYHSASSTNISTTHAAHNRRPSFGSPDALVAISASNYTLPAGASLGGITALNGNGPSTTENLHSQ